MTETFLSHPRQATLTSHLCPASSAAEAIRPPTGLAFPGCAHLLRIMVGTLPIAAANRWDAAAIALSARGTAQYMRLTDTGLSPT
jgi:hypothetical protein